MVCVVVNGVVVVLLMVVVMIAAWGNGTFDGEGSAGSLVVMVDAVPSVYSLSLVCICVCV